MIFWHHNGAKQIEIFWRFCSGFFGREVVGTLKWRLGSLCTLQRERVGHIFSHSRTWPAGWRLSNGRKENSVLSLGWDWIEVLRPGRSKREATLGLAESLESLSSPSVSWITMKVRTLPIVLINLPITKPDPYYLFVKIQLVADLPHLFGGRFGILDKCLLQRISDVVLNWSSFLSFLPQ